MDLIKVAILILVGLNIVAIAGTVTINAWRSRRDRWLERKVEKFEPALYELLDTGKVPPELRETRDKEQDVLSALICRIISMLPEERDRDRLVELANDLGLVERDLNRLQSEKIQIRAYAAERLGFYGGSDVVGDLRKLLAGEHETPRALAAHALLRVGTREAAQALVDHLDAPRELTRLRIADNLESMGPVATEPLIELLEDPEKPLRARILATRVLGNLEVPEARPSLIRALCSEDLDLMAQAVQALGKIGDSASLETVLEATEDSRWPLRAQAAAALGKIADEAAIPTLKKLMTDPEWWVRSNAGHALAKMGISGERALVEMLDSPDDYARERAAASLEDSGAVRRAVDALTECGEREEWSRKLIRQIVGTEVSRHLQYLAKRFPESEKRRELQKMMSEVHES